jgi:outer membrane protein assembly factor BamD (BamD/ComL family)
MGIMQTGTTLRQIVKVALALLVMLVVTTAAHAQKKQKDALSGYERSARATLVHPAIVYVTADDNAEHVDEILPGHEIVVIEHTGTWVRVFANIDAADQQDETDKPEFNTDQQKTPASGWIRDKGIITPGMAGGDAILFGSAANYEAEAALPHPSKDAAANAHLLYRRVYEYFPDSQLAVEATYRSANVRWQLDRADISTLPSAHEQEAYLRPQIYEGDMRRVLKLYPTSSFAALAAYDLIDNNLCGDWQGLPKCPDMEAGLYEKYAARYPNSPRAAEALYNATYREAVLVEMYKGQDDPKRAAQAIANTQGLADELKQRYPQSDYTARAASLAYRVQQGINVYVSDRE